ncbi:hypothetical protein SKAU_G00391970 [Synaphobranchus kaupii]|uniref:TNFAIP3-interacting protein 2 n=1 Tax=Synaphobranchus kaupii TaxID=118154 RepID=A0A9Q1EBT4_SYNKA|nr:hypothetical protein SKAU_G00391970 [Synaphobranchus kaupii]
MSMRRLRFLDFTERDMENIKAENDASKTKLLSSYMLNTLYHGTGQEIDSLGHRIFLKDSTTADLEGILGAYEGACMKVDTEKHVVFGPSKTSLDSLCNDNETRNLKQRLTDTETNAAQQSKTNKLEVDRLQQSAWEAEREISGIADRQLQKEFRRRTTEGQRTTKGQQDPFCSSLQEDPANQLRAQLGATTRVCQDLLKRLERKRQGDESLEKGSHDLQFEEFTDSSKAAHLDTLVCKLREENRELKQRIARVENLNSQWQKYDLGREGYVKALYSRLKESSPPSGVGAGPAPLRSALLQEEIARLNRLLDEKMKDCTKLSWKLEDSRIRDRERIQTLEQQALIYTEDFKSERADRERAQGRIQDLQEEVLRLQLKLHKKQESRDPPAACWVHIGHGMSAHMQADAAEPQVTSADRPGLQCSSRELPQVTVRTDRQGSTDLLCPRCLVCYDGDHAAEYMKHFEECANV